MDFCRQNWLNEIGKSGKLGRNTLHHIKSVVSGFFTLAKQQGYFDGENPARNTAINPNAPEPEEPLDEVQSILAVLPEPAATAFAVAAYIGLRHGEIQGLRWEDYRDAEMYVTRSIWNGHVTAPKTRKGRAPVPVIRQLANRLEAHRTRCKNAQEGPIFKNLVGKPLNMNNLLKRTMLPALNRCEKCGKPEANHITANHKFERDASIPVWHGWHSARRGLGSNLYALGVSEKVIQRILRHANVSTTATYYIKAAADDVQIAMETLEKNIPERSNFDWDTKGTLKLDRSRVSSVPN